MMAHIHDRSIPATLALALLLSATLMSVEPAGASFPGENGLIVYGRAPSALFSDGEIYTMDSGGGGGTPLTGNTAYDGPPSWSIGGSSIAFESMRDGDTEIYVMGADGVR